MKLVSSRLTVNIDEPGTKQTGTRFDVSSFVTSVVLDDVQEFLSQESVEASEGCPTGRGLVCEFGLPDPLHYDDATVGELFPKLGVGFLKKHAEEPYDFFHPYDVAKRPDISWKLSPTHDAVRFVQRYFDDKTFHCELVRTWALEENRLSTSVTLTNKGSLPIKTSEYCHNFVRPGLGGLDDGIQFQVNWNLARQPRKFVNPDGVLALGQNEILLHGKTKNDFYASFLEGDGPRTNPAWGLFSRKDGRFFMGETLQGDLHRCDLWGRAHVVSLELFKDICVEPDHSETWVRVFSFGQ